MTERVIGVVARDVLVAEPGLSFLRGLIEGRHPAPPFSQATGIHLTEADPERVVFRGTPTPAFFNPLGTIHGGWTSAILDSAMAWSTGAGRSPPPRASSSTARAASSRTAPRPA